MLKRLLVLGISCCSGLAMVGHAAEEGTGGLDEQDFFQDLPVVVSVTRLPQTRAESPAAITVIDRSMIEASGAQQIPDLLRLVAGFQVGHVHGNRTTVTYHGMSDEYARRMQVLVDGRSVYMPATGGVDWFDIPLAIEDIERIEVLRGPNAVAYGANSFLGVINIITQHPDKTVGNTVRYTHGDNGNQRTLLRHGAKSGDLSYRVTLSHEEDDGYPDVWNGGTLDQYYDRKVTDMVNARGEYRASVNDYLSVQAGLNQGPRGDGFPTDITWPPHDYRTKRLFAQLRWKRVMSSDSDFEWQLYHIDSNIDARYQTAKLSDIFGVSPATVQGAIGRPDQAIPIIQDTHTRRYDLEFQHRFRALNKVRVAWGGELRVDEVDAPGYLNRSAPIQNHLSRLFANAEWHASPDWLVNTGAMLERNEITGTKVSPRFAVNYRLSPRYTVRAGYTRAYRTPSIFEEYADYGPKLSDGTVIDQIWKSNGGLQAERMDSTELGLVGELPKYGLSFDVRLFRERLRDLIATPIDRAFSEPFSYLCALNDGFCRSLVFNNDGYADVEGLELQLKYRPTNTTSLSVGYSHTNAHGRIAKDLNPSDYLDAGLATPTDTVSLLLDHGWGHGWRSAVGFYAVSNMRYIGGDATGGYQTIDLHVAKDFQVSGNKASIAVTAQDVYGDYYDFQNWVVRGQRIYVTAGLTF